MNDDTRHPRMPESVSDDIDPAMVPVLRAMTPARRTQIADGMFRSARSMLTRLIRSEHPDWSDEQVARSVASRLAHGAI